MTVTSSVILFFTIAAEGFFARVGGISWWCPLWGGHVFVDARTPVSCNICISGHCSRCAGFNFLPSSRTGQWPSSQHCSLGRQAVLRVCWCLFSGLCDYHGKSINTITRDGSGYKCAVRSSHSTCDNHVILRWYFGRWGWVAYARISIHTEIAFILLPPIESTF